MGKNNAKMIDVNLALQAGFGPNGLPVKMTFDNAEYLPENIRKQLRILDEQDAIGRYRWFNLPDGLDQELIERILYYCGQGALFYEEYSEKYYFLPYSLHSSDAFGGVDVYGRYRQIIPVQYRGSKTFDKDGKAKIWVQGLTRRPIYDINEIPEDKNEDAEDYVMSDKKVNFLKNACVLLSDYCKQSSEENIARQLLQDPLLGVMSEVFPLARTAMIARSGVKAMRVNNEDEYSNVVAVSNSIEKAAKCGKPFVPVVGSMEFQNLTDGESPLKAEEFLILLQAFDNYRLSLYGLKSGGLFQKKAHMLEGEQEMNNANNTLVYEDGLRQRQQFCDRVNALWGLGIACLPSEAAMGIDMNGDGIIGDQQDQSGMEQGDQPVDTEVSENE